MISAHGGRGKDVSRKLPGLSGHWIDEDTGRRSKFPQFRAGALSQRRKRCRCEEQREKDDFFSFHTSELLNLMSGTCDLPVPINRHSRMGIDLKVRHAAA